MSIKTDLIGEQIVQGNNCLLTVYQLYIKNGGKKCMKS